MFEALGYKVEKLDRVAYGDVTYEGIPRGKFRYMTKTEIRSLERSAGIIKKSDQ
jgi:23S rRNA pseudouridine2605 synthase